MSKGSRTLVNLLAFLLFFFTFDRLGFQALKGLERSALEKQGFLALFVHRRAFYRNFFDIPRGTFDTVVMGTSRTHRGIHPYYLYKHAGLSAFKNANAKCKPKFNYFFYQRYKQHAGAPSVLIYGLDYFMFMVKTNAPFLRRFTGEDESALDARGISLLWSNKAAIDEMLNDALGELAGAGEDEKGSGPPRQRRDLPPSAAHIDPFIGYAKLRAIDGVRPARVKRFPYVPFPGREGEWFLKLLREFERDGVTVFLVNLPDHIGTYESNFEGAKFMADIGRLTGRFRNVHVLDYNRPDRFPLARDSHFLDGGYGWANSHLSDQGARELNRLLAVDLKKIMRRR